MASFYKYWQKCLGVFQDESDKIIYMGYLSPNDEISEEN